MTVAKMVKAEIAYSFQDIHTGVIYEPGTVQEFTETRLAEIHQNLPGFVKELEELDQESVDEPAEEPDQESVDETEQPPAEEPKKPKKKSGKAKVADDEPAVD